MQQDKIAPCLPGFDSIHRYWDEQKQLSVAKIQPGELYVTRTDEAITTVLGSCIAACIRDVDLCVGGMNHFMLPLQGNHYDSDSISDEALRYGNWAMEYLINNILKAGGRRRSLEIKIFGGGSIVSNISEDNRVGKKNIQFILDYLYDENLVAKSKDLGGNYARSIIYYPKSGKALMKQLDKITDTTLAITENQYQSSISKQTQNTDIELF